MRLREVAVFSTSVEIIDDICVRDAVHPDRMAFDITGKKGTAKRVVVLGQSCAWVIMIKQLIESENKSSPLSDQSIQEHFKRKDINIARRTISKYRQVLRILPSHLRKS